MAYKRFLTKNNLRAFFYSDEIAKRGWSPVNRDKNFLDESGNSEANLVSSEIANVPGMHQPAIDIDGCEVTVYPSSTSGNYHLYIDKPMPWWKYRLLLRTMVLCGLVERKYYDHCVRQKASFLRVPWVRKNPYGWQHNPQTRQVEPNVPVETPFAPEVTNPLDYRHPDYDRPATDLQPVNYEATEANSEYFAETGLHLTLPNGETLPLTGAPNDGGPITYAHPGNKTWKDYTAAK